MIAWLNLRHNVGERVAAFEAGLRRHGYRVEQGVPKRPPGDADLFVSWNRLHIAHSAAAMFEQHGCQVLIAENAAWGNDFAGGNWLSLALNYHNQQGRTPVGGPERWDSLGVEPAPFRQSGETVIVPQRGIGPAATRMPTGWPTQAQERHGGRIRPHPGMNRAKPLEDDLARCGKVVTWGSGAAVKALLLGIPVVSEMPNWIAEQDNTEAGRVAMFRRLAWAQWRLSEIESGEAFACLLNA